MEANANKSGTLNIVWKLITYRPWIYLLTTLLWIVKDTIPLIYGILVKEIFDIINGKVDSTSGVLPILAPMLAVSIVQVLILRIGFITSITSKFSKASLVRRNILNVILKRPGAAAIKTSIGEAINSLRDDVGQTISSIDWLSWLIGQIARAIFAVAILLTINIRITVFVFTPLAAVILLVRTSEKRVEKNREESREATAGVTGAVGEIFESVLAIKVSGAQQNIINNLKKLNERRYRLVLKDSLLTQLIDSIYNNAISLGTGLILLLSAQAIRNGSFSIGDFALFIYYLAFVTDSIESAGNFLVFFKQTGVSVNRMKELIQSMDGKELALHKDIYLTEKGFEEEIMYQDHADNCIDPLQSLKVDGLTYSYGESGKGIDNINFSICKEETLVVCGRTGSGKSTLLKVLLGLLPGAAGEIYWNEEKVSDPQSFFVPPVISYTSQVPNLFSQTVKNNILLGIPEEKAELDKAVNTAVLDEDIKGFELGMDTYIGPKGIKLSGGQQQRVAAARMFIRKGHLMFFDDISSALDVETEKSLWSRLLSGDRPACIIVSNRRYALERADKIIVMNNGIIEAQGKLEDLLQNSEEMRKIWC